MRHPARNPRTSRSQPRLRWRPTRSRAEEGEGEVEGDPHIVWATKKYGTDPDRWAKAAFDQERFISALAQDKKQAEEAAMQAYAYAQQVEANAQSGPGGMPMSAQQEAWVEQSLSNPVGYAYQAAMSGDAQLYNAVIERVARDGSGDGRERRHPGAVDDAPGAPAHGGRAGGSPVERRRGPGLQRGHGPVLPAPRDQRQSVRAADVGEDRRAGRVPPVHARDPRR